MFVTFFTELKSAGVPVTLREYLTLMEAMQADLASRRVEDFYYLSRAALVKDERNLDKFDRVFGHVFKGLEAAARRRSRSKSPPSGSRSSRRNISPTRRRSRSRPWAASTSCSRRCASGLPEQKGRHQGGNKWIGTGGTSPFGAYGYNPEGVRIGQDESRNHRAVKVWDKREFKDLDGDVELGTRNIKLALRRLRKFARTGAPEELDLDGTIRGTAHKGYLDILMRPERHNAVKVLLFFDIGGSMDWHIKATEELFSAARTEFKHMEHFYFHNCLYEKVWKENRRRWNDTTPTWDVLHTYPHDYKVIFVGDASMSPYEIAAPGGSVEHFNEEAGHVWMERVTRTYPACVWLNPVPESEWGYTQSIRMMRQLMGGRMYPLTLEGLDRGDAGVGAVNRPAERSVDVPIGSLLHTPPLGVGGRGRGVGRRAVPGPQDIADDRIGSLGVGSVRRAECAAVDVQIEDFGSLVDRIASVIGERSLHSGLVFVGSAFHAVIGGKLGNIVAHMHDGKMSRGVEDVDAFGIWSPRVNLCAVFHGAVGSDEDPRADNILADCAHALAFKPNVGKVASKTSSSRLILAFIISPLVMVELCLDWLTHADAKQA